MDNSVPNLWPNIEVKVLSPVAVLKQQAHQLSSVTKGVLEAEVRSLHFEKGSVRHDFVITAKAIGYSHVLFSASHDRELVYPVALKFKQWDDQARLEFIKSREGILHRSEEIPDGDKFAPGPDELKNHLQAIFHSDQAKSVVMSMIAKSNDNSITADDLPPPQLPK